MSIVLLYNLAIFISGYLLGYLLREKGRNTARKDEYSHEPMKIRAELPKKAEIIRKYKDPIDEIINEDTTIR